LIGNLIALTKITIVALLGLLTLSGCHSPVTLQSLEVSPVNPSIAAGTSVQLSATAIYRDGSHADVTNQATWNSSGTAVATVGAATGRTVAVAPGVATLSASLQGRTAGTTLTVTAASLLTVTIIPASPALAAGTSQAFKATGTFSNNTTQDLTADMNWASSDTAVATVDASGVGTGISAGSATITATCKIVDTCGSGSIAGSAALTVTAATLTSITLTPRSAGIALGTTQQFTATGTYTDHSTQSLTTQVTWMSANAPVASLSAAGLAASLATGTSAITASFGSITSAPAILTVTPATLVSIQVTPANPSIGLGTTQQFTATGTYTDNSIQDITRLATWVSGTPGIATVSNAPPSNGLAGTVAPGMTNITATFGGVTSNPVNLSVFSVNTTLAASVSSLALSIYDTGLSSSLTGRARQIAITNTGTVAATAVVYTATPALPPGTTLSPASCGDLAPAATCLLMVTPGGTPSAAPGDTNSIPIALTVMGTNTNTVSTSISILAYGSVYQSGYVFSIDDTTPITGSIGGSVASLDDQGNSIAWNTDLSSIGGIAETSTPSSPDPVISAGMLACNGNSDGACDTSNIVGFYSTGSSPQSLASYAAGICEGVFAGYMDWYLPAICEMGYDSLSSGNGCGTGSSPLRQNMQSNLVDTGVVAGLSGSYWSSTEHSGNPAALAWVQYFAGGGSDQAVTAKFDQISVRCVRNMTY